MRTKGQPAPEYVLLHRQAMSMHAAGKPTREIVQALGVPRQCVNRWIRNAATSR